MTRIFGRMEKELDYQMRQGVYAVIFNEDKSMILTVQNSDGAYFLPGGGIEENEDFHQCLTREVLEETGYSIVIRDFIGNAHQYFLSRNNKPYLGDGHFYITELVDKRQQPTEADHFTSWLEINKAENLLYHDYHHWAVKEGVKVIDKKRQSHLI